MKDLNNKVLLGMSGGVDSCVSALLLQKAGYEVYGVTLQLFDGRCCNDDNILDAKKVCKSLGIEHYVLDFKEEFKEKVINNFIEEYSLCRTPNPCIECNRFLKFGVMYEKAKELGIDHIATGHYAKVEYSEKYGKHVLKKATNIAKDQSYVLYVIEPELLEHIVFPLGDIDSKDTVRKIAKESGLQVASKPDSEDICFIVDGNYKNFLEVNSNLKPTEGNIVTTKGEILGKHTGLYNYTIGQRKGMGIAYECPLYVVGFNPQKNELVVGTESELYKKELWVDNFNLLLPNKDDLKTPLKVNVKTRYSSKEYPAEIQYENDLIHVVFDEPQARITPGQSAVFYMDDIVVGGGKIMR